MNIIYLGKYTLNDYYASAGSKRVLNQIEYLIEYNNIKVITISKYKSRFRFNINLKRVDNNLIYLILLPIYWMLICIILLMNKRRGKNIILLESIVELNFSIPIIFSKLLGYKVIHDIVENFFLSHESTIAQKRNNIISSYFYYNINRYSDGFLAISEKLIDQYSCYNKPIIKLYNSIQIEPITKTNNSKNELFTFLYSGTFGVKDGVKDLILAFNRLSENYSDTKLVLTGGNNSVYFNECLELIETNDKIFYLGYLSIFDLQIECNKADVLMVIRDKSPFANYGFPFKLSEYLAYRKPVIASKISDIPLLFSDYHDILLVEPSDIDSIVDKMDYAYKNRLALEQIATNGYLKAKDYFSIDKNGIFLNNFMEAL